MKRSEINALIQDAEAFFAAHHFHLPEWGRWSPAQWKGKGEVAAEIVRNGMGWDLTDFGSGAFERRGLILFAIRNGRLGVDRKPYAEKIMIVRENQETPMHFHWYKMEDIINRGGGNLMLQLKAATEDEAFSEESFDVSIDGIVHRLACGAEVTLKPGQSICLPQRLYHRFWGEEGKGKVLVGEVSMVNDDNTDNRFFDGVGRFPDIEEDEAPYRLLVNDYPGHL
ncbi:MAG: D-lyxose/D-mannose family sugar isomerase [Lentisphaerae bacterium]|nr:D-lyxose/D-mannose family sugar isomerase [Lentisphaerota bacterium]